jgi:predicted porin
VRIQTCVKLRGALGALSLGVCLLWTPPAAAELTVFQTGDWSFFTEGRINAFISQGFGDEFPAASPNPNDGPAHDLIGASALYAAGQSTNQGDSSNKYFAARIRNGFVGSILGFGIKRKLSETTTVKGFVALWGHAETFGRDRTNFSKFDVREGYVNFDGSWGTLTAGRTLGLFGRMSTEIDFTYGHNYGLGYPCGDDQGPTCGHIGTGVMFPGFGAGFLYSTPSLEGLKLHVGLFDPVRLLGAWNRAPIARPEAAVTFEQKLGDSGMFKLGVEGMFQPVARLTTAPDNPAKQIDVTDKVWGVAGGGRLEVGPVRLGVAAFRGKGLGQYYALQNSPAVFNASSYEIRSFTGVYAQSALVFGPAQIAAGVGRVTVDQLPADKIDPLLSNAKSQTGISVAFYYSVSDNLALGIDYFRFMADWYGAPNSVYDADRNVVVLPGVITPEKQAVNYINVGATYHW